MFKRLFALARGLISAYKKNFAVGILVGAGLFLLTYFFVVPWVRTFVPVVTIGVVGSYTPASLPRFIQEELSLGLTKPGPDLSASPAAAISWNISPDGKTYLFKLADGLVWHDGKKFSSKDVNYNLADVVVVYPDDKSVQFTLKDVFSPLPAILSQPLFRPGLIGLGEYRMINFKTSGRFLLSLRIKSAKEEILYKFYPTEKAAKMALSLGEISRIVGYYPGSGVADYGVVAAVVFNVNDPVAADKAFRQGLAYSTPGSFDLGVSTDGPIPEISWAYNKNLKKYPFDLVQAKKLLSKNVSSQSADFTLSVDPRLTSVGEIVADSWRQTGVKVKTTSYETLDQKSGALLTLLPVSSDPDQYGLWHSKSLGNIAKYKSPKVDLLLEEGRRATESAIRRSKYFDFQKAITEDVPAIFLFFPYLSRMGRN